MRIYKAFPAYQSYLEGLYRKNPRIKDLSFQRQLSELENDYFPWVLTWNQFNTDEGVEVFETIHNDFYLQQSWCNNNFIMDVDWQKKIVIEQIKFFQPDVCIIYPPEFFPSEFVARIREVVRHPVIVGGYDGMDRKNINLYDGYDFVITCSKYISEYYSNKGFTTFALEFGFDPKVLSNLKVSKNRYPVSFSGSIFEGIHDDRLELLRVLIRNGLNVTISSEYEIERRYSLLSRRLLRSIKNRTFVDYYEKYQIHKHNIGPLFGREMFQFLYDSDITLNLHGDKISFAANVRLYEATGVGTCLLTDWKKNISEIFEPDKEIVTFRTKEEACDRINFLKKHEKARIDIAQNAKKRTLSEYTYAQRIPKVIQFVKQL